MAERELDRRGSNFTLQEILKMIVRLIDAFHFDFSLVTNLKSWNSAEAKQLNEMSNKSPPWEFEKTPAELVTITDLFKSAICLFVLINSTCWPLLVHYNMRMLSYFGELLWIWMDLRIQDVETR